MIVLVVVAAGFGYALRAWLEPNLAEIPLAEDSVPLAGDRDADAEVASLRAQLAEQLEARSRLEQQFAQLRDDALELAAVYREEFDPELDSSPADEGPLATAAGDVEPGLPGRPAHELPGARPQPKGVSMSALAAAGFGEVEATRIRERIESMLMRQLYLSDAAKREGWHKTRRFRQAYAQIGGEFDEMRAEYGEGSFDWILYSVGRKNRVVVDSVLGDSPAATAGLQPGDLVIGYADSRTFNGSELVKATGRGSAGELVVLEFERKGESQRVYVPRGPLGIQLHNATLPPSR